MHCTTLAASIAATCSRHVAPRRSVQDAACVNRWTRAGRPPSGARDARCRSRDRDDIRALSRAQRVGLNLDEVAGYFALFDRKELLDELLAEIDAEAE